MQQELRHIEMLQVWTTSFVRCLHVRADRSPALWEGPEPRGQRTIVQVDAQVIL